MTNTTNRKTSFDIIRILAILIIFNYHFCIEAGLVDSIFCSHKNGGWGSVGTTIFFLLSGYLIHMGSKNTQPLVYIKKRFFSIYPALWISFIFVYLLTSLKLHNFLWGGQPWRLIFSIVGIDTYLQYYFIQAYACVGEWFTGMILFLYASYLLLRFLIKKCPVITTIVITILYFLECTHELQPIVPPDASVFTGVMLFWLGMLMQEYPFILKEYWWKTAIAIIITLLVIFVQLPFYGNVLPWKNLLGITLFYLINVLFSKINFGSNAGNALKFFSSISFGVYLVHHFIIAQLYYHLTTRPIILIYSLALLISVITAIAITKITGLIKH
ncbi:MAG: acyltransferase [Pseudobutyrivibrio sp.]|nr:acyltransferase [Pseudobutyrivibrio sp.]